MPRRRGVLVAGAAYTVAMAATAIVAAWPIYAGAAFVVVTVAALVGALALAAASVERRSPGWAVVVGASGLFVVLGLALAVPRPWTSAGAVIEAMRDLVWGAVTGFKDLLTVDLPVGGYRNLLVPVLIVVLVGTLATVLLAWRTDRFAGLATVPALGMTVFGLLFGRTTTSDALRAGPLVIPAPVEIAVGASALIATVAWLAWRSHEDRRAALRRAANVSGVRVSRRASSIDRRRRALAAGMIAVAVIGGAAVSPAIAQTREREVLRSAAGPQLAIARAVSPLERYRADFTGEAVDQVLFRVEAVQGALPDRIRIATLTSYDGATYRVADPSGVAADARFTRVPSRLDGGKGATTVARIRIEGLEGIWLPTFGALEQIEFDRDAAALADAFYYNVSTRAAVETARGGLRAGDGYTLTAVTSDPAPLADIQPPGTEPAVPIPDSVAMWIKAQNAGTGGAALQTLVDRLRERGYLSHALDVPAEGAQWMQALGPDYAFQPSASGHSLARIDTVFTKLLERQTAAAGQRDAVSLVAAVGDDEQFAVAAAVIAEELGFPARVVVGARLTGDDEGVPPCQAGVCRGGNVAAWLEVASQDGEWVPVDVTPQHEAGADTAVTRERDPEVPTDVRPDAAEEVVPPDPVQQDATAQNDPEAAGPDLAVLWAVLRTAGLVALALAVIVGPLLVIVAAKALRRRARREAATPVSRIVGGWDEYVDAAVDHGRPAPRVDTRGELATRYDTRHGADLAVVADRAVFSEAALTAAESDEFWRIVDSERRDLVRSETLWRRLAAAVSLKSFTRGLAPRFTRGRVRAPRRIERRGRRRGDDAR